MSDMSEKRERLIRHDFRLRESVWLRLAQLKVSDMGGSWSDIFERWLDSLDGKKPRDDPDKDPASWPEGRVLTPKVQREVEATLIVDYPYLMDSRSFRTAYRAIRGCPTGSKRAQLLALLLDNYEQGEVGQETDLFADVQRARHRSIIKHDEEKEWAPATWSERGRSEYERLLDPRRTRATPTYRVALEHSGIDLPALQEPEPKQLTGAPTALPKPPSEEDEAQYQESVRRSMEEALQALHPPAAAPFDTKDPDYRAWFKATFGKEPEEAPP
jgi:hypothetical protein